MGQWDEAKELDFDFFQNDEQGALEEAVAACDKEHFDGGHVYRCTLEADCRQLLARVTKINEETAKATEQCIEHQVRTIVTAADEINMHTRQPVKISQSTSTH